MRYPSAGDDLSRGGVDRMSAVIANVTALLFLNHAYASPGIAASGLTVTSANAVPFTCGGLFRTPLPAGTVWSFTGFPTVPPNSCVAYLLMVNSAGTPSVVASTIQPYPGGNFFPDFPGGNLVALTNALTAGGASGCTVMGTVLVTTDTPVAQWNPGIDPWPTDTLFLSGLYFPMVFPLFPFGTPDFIAP